VSSTIATAGILSPEQISSFHDRGVLKVNFSLDSDLLDNIVEKVHPYYSQEYRRGELVIERVQDAWKLVDEVRQLAVHKSVTTALKQLLGRRPLAFQTLNFPRATEQQPHADVLHFNCEPGGYMVGVWVALEDIDEANGPLIYYPGSHRLPEYSMQDFDLEPGFDDYPEYTRRIQRIIQEQGLSPEYGQVKKGEAIIWHANLLHGGAAHKDRTRTRHSQVTHYYFEGCRYFTPIFSGKRRRRYRFPFWIPETDKYILPENRSIPAQLFRRVINKLRGG
jgi:hypothetical protein